MGWFYSREGKWEDSGESGPYARPVIALVNMLRRARRRRNPRPVQSRTQGLLAVTTIERAPAGSERDVTRTCCEQQGRPAREVMPVDPLAELVDVLAGWRADVETREAIIDQACDALLRGLDSLALDSALAVCREEGWNCRGETIEFECMILEEARLLVDEA